MLKKKFYLSFLLILTLAVSVFAAGCASSPAEEDSLERVLSAGQISFAMSGGYPPFNFYDEDNVLKGFDVDVASEIAERLGVEFVPVTTDWSGIIEGLRSGVYDGILGSMAITEEREKVVDFSVPYYYSGAQLVVAENSSLAAKENLEGKIIGVVTGTTYEQDASVLNPGDVRLYKDDNQTLMELGSGVIDAVITDRVVAVNAVNGDDFALELLDMPLRSEDIGVAFRDSDDTLREKVNQILQEMHEDGSLSAVSEKWLNTDVTVK